jgi:lipopolysaccharide export system protein LptC
LYATHAAHPLDDTRRFRAAARHSRRVRALRIVIPIVVALALLAVVFVSVFNPWRMLVNLPIEMGDLVVSGTKITMEAPRMAGFTPDGRAYEVTAQAAAQDLMNPTQVELQKINARIEMQDKSQVRVTAAKGLFDTKSETLKLNERIVLESSNYEGHLQEATVSMKQGTVFSKKPVKLKFLNGDLDAQGLSITENGALILFEGGVSMTLTINNPSPADAQPASSTQ